MKFALMQTISRGESGDARWSPGHMKHAPHDPDPGIFYLAAIQTAWLARKAYS